MSGAPEYTVDTDADGRIAVRLRGLGGWALLEPEAALRFGAALIAAAVPPAAEVVRHQERGVAGGFAYGYAQARALASAKPPAFHAGGFVAPEGVATRAIAEHLAEMSTAELNERIDAAERGESLNVGMSIQVDGRELPRVARRIVHRRRDGEPASVWTLPPGEGPVVVSIGTRTQAEVQELRDGAWATVGALPLEPGAGATVADYLNKRGPYSANVATAEDVARSAWAAEGFSLEAAPPGTYAHVTPDEDLPEDHSEGGCACQPRVDEAYRVVFHRPLSTLESGFSREGGPYSANVATAPELPAELRGPAEPTVAERAMGWLEDIHGRTR